MHMHTHNSVTENSFTHKVQHTLIITWCYSLICLRPSPLRLLPCPSHFHTCFVSIGRTWHVEFSGPLIYWHWKPKFDCIGVKWRLSLGWHSNVDQDRKTTATQGGNAIVCNFKRIVIAFNMLCVLSCRQTISGYSTGSWYVLVFHLFATALHDKTLLQFAFCSKM